MPPQATTPLMKMYPPGHGFWGKVTANIDWCEANYEVTVYIAEFWNTVSSLFIIFFAILSGYQSFVRKAVEFRYILLSIGTLAVGIGSVLFHMTLIYELQLLDELPMIWGIGPFLYVAYELPQKKNRFNFALAFVVIAACVASTYAYLTNDLRIIFEGTYVAILLVASGHLYLNTKRLDQKVFRFFLIAVGIYLLAGAVWMVDKFACHHLTTARETILHPIVHPLSQLHAVWHLLAGLASHMLILACVRTRLVVLAKHEQFGLRYGFIPYYKKQSKK